MIEIRKIKCTALGFLEPPLCLYRSKLLWTY